jgi:hypothetical protein
MADIDVMGYDGEHHTFLVCEACEKNDGWWYRAKCEHCHKFVSTSDPNVEFHQHPSWDGGIEWDGYIHKDCTQSKRTPPEAP